MPALIIFLLIFILGPIPLFHITLHVFLRLWRRAPHLLYISATILWALSLSLALYAYAWPAALFFPPLWLQVFGIIFGACSVALILWAFFTLGPKRFMVWAVVAPEAVEQRYIKTGPYRLLPHPAYLGYMGTGLSVFLATGLASAFSFFIYSLVFLMIVILLENQEMKNRLKDAPQDLA